MSTTVPGSGFGQRGGRGTAPRIAFARQRYSRHPTPQSPSVRKNSASHSRRRGSSGYGRETFLDEFARRRFPVRIGERVREADHAIDVSRTLVMRLAREIEGLLGLAEPSEAPREIVSSARSDPARSQATRR